ncbi:SphA family protein [Flavobacterium tistrianum]|uniref:SphA family protein n=1 Tax=Flavobacterium tistrianum TaxID=1685414 RepID=UPI000DABD3A0|nr:transporter [Flavobacterium tistrianum]KAF2343121.1 transporter [Flavobacterium tistrianum]
MKILGTGAAASLSFIEFPHAPKFIFPHHPLKNLVADYNLEHVFGSRQIRYFLNPLNFRQQENGAPMTARKYYPYGICRSKAAFPSKKSKRIAAIFTLLFFCAASADAQLKGTHLLGDMGLQSGTQAPPSFMPAVALYDYQTSKLIRADGEKLDIPHINMFLLGFGGNFVTNFKILGGNYGGSVLIAFASSRIEGDLVSTKSSLAFTDMYIQPLQLGWKTKKADFTAGYALYLPTGKYELGGDDNAGMGILSNEFSAGTTYYFDAQKEWNISALFSYALNSRKKNTGGNELKPGSLLTVEGGLGRTWIKPVKGNPMPMVINAGLVYYMQFKATKDEMMIPQINNVEFDLKNKDRIYALGAEGNIFIPSIKSSIGIRWLGELGAVNRTQGNSFFLTLAPCASFFEPKKKP